jgi:hypothetical protein
MNALTRGLVWPIASLIAIGFTHLAAELARPALQSAIGPAVVAPVYLVVGAWAALATLRAGGSVWLGVLTGAIVGLLPVGLQIVGFGLIAGRDTESVATNAIFGFLGLLWGGFLGTGLAQSFPRSAAS